VIRIRQAPLRAPEAIAVVPDGSYAYVASTAGADAIVVDPGVPGYLTKEEIQHATGLIDVASSPDGRRVYGVSAMGDELVEIDSDPADGLVFNTILASPPVLADPKGIALDPSGDRAFIPTDESEIQIWDIHLGSASSPADRRPASPGGLAAGKMRSRLPETVRLRHGLGELSS
jgi:DNA-binding beta-propeller fold protein YncE